MSINIAVLSAPDRDFDVLRDDVLKEMKKSYDLLVSDKQGFLTKDLFEMSQEGGCERSFCGYI